LQWRQADAAVAGDDAGHALGNLELEVGRFENREIVVGVAIDEPGRSTKREGLPLPSITLAPLMTKSQLAMVESGAGFSLQPLFRLRN
jgi:hypothetical protein